MFAARLRLDSRGRVLLPPALRARCGLAATAPLSVVLAEDRLLVGPATEPEPRPPRLDRKGRLTLPGALRTALGLGPGALLLARAAPPGLHLALPASLLARQREARLALRRRLDEA